jgi:hypothetical protein
MASSRPSISRSRLHELVTEAYAYHDQDDTAAHEFVRTATTIVTGAAKYQPDPNTIITCVVAGTLLPNPRSLYDDDNGKLYHVALHLDCLINDNHAPGWPITVTDP